MVIVHDDRAPEYLVGFSAIVPTRGVIEGFYMFLAKVDAKRPQKPAKVTHHHVGMLAYPLPRQAIGVLVGIVPIRWPKNSL